MLQRRERTHALRCVGDFVGRQVLSSNAVQIGLDIASRRMKVLFRPSQSQD